MDALSRCSSFQVLVVGEELDTVWERMKRCQEMDEELTRLKVKVQQNKADCYVVEKGLLCKEVQQERLIVVPKRMQSDVIRRCHEQSHFRVAKTEQLVRRDYWFQGMQEKNQRSIQNFVTCILAERKHGKPEGFCIR